MGLSMGAFKGILYDAGLVDGPGETPRASSEALFALLDLEEAGGRPGGGPGSGMPGCHRRFLEDEREVDCSLTCTCDTSPVDAARFALGGWGSEPWSGDPERE
jgi:hypothetical protein